MVETSEIAAISSITLGILPAASCSSKLFRSLWSFLRIKRPFSINLLSSNAIGTAMSSIFVTLTRSTGGLHGGNGVYSKTNDTITTCGRGLLRSVYQTAAFVVRRQKLTAYKMQGCSYPASRIKTSYGSFGEIEAPKQRKLLLKRVLQGGFVRGN